MDDSVTPRRSAHQLPEANAAGCVEAPGEGSRGHLEPEENRQYGVHYLLPCPLSHLDPCLTQQIVRTRLKRPGGKPSRYRRGEALSGFKRPQGANGRAEPLAPLPVTILFLLGNVFRWIVQELRRFEEEQPGRHGEKGSGQAQIHRRFSVHPRTELRSHHGQGDLRGRQTLLLHLSGQILDRSLESGQGELEGLTHVHT